MPTPTAPHSPCIDAETLAAWSERSLSSEDAAEVELHLSDCVRCQRVLAAFARTLEEPRQAQLLRARWLVPLAAAAAILIWIAMPKPEPAQAPTAVVARNEAPAILEEARGGAPVQPPATLQEPKESNQLAHAADKALAADNAGNAKVEAASKADARERQTSKAAPAPASTPGVGNLPGGRAGALAGPPPRRAADALSSPRGNVLIDGVSPVPAPPPPSAPPPPPPMPATLPPPAPVRPPPAPQAVGGALADAAKAAPEQEVRLGGSGGQVSVGERSLSVTSPLTRQLVLEIVSADPGTGAGPAVPGTVGGVAGGRGGGGAGARGGSAAVAGRGSPVGFAPTSTRWRILGPGTAERSTDGGRSWDAIAIDPPVTVTAGTSPSPAVCWLIGPRGVVLLSVDGLHFDRRLFPETTDLSSIRATDAAHASVTTSAGRVFETSDGGRSWQARN